MRPLAEASGLTKRFGGTVAVADLDLALAAGEVLGLAGRNGAGKTTTLAMLAGVLPPDAGVITLAGERFTRERRELRRMIGLVPQEAAVYPELSTLDNLACFGGLYGLAGGALRTRATELIDLFGLAAVADRPTARLSGGMRRRASLAVALLHRPRLLLLDEPTAGLDLEFRPRLHDIVRGLARDGAAVVWAAHDLAEVESVWDAVVVLDSGRRVVCERVPDLLDGQAAASGNAVSNLERAVGLALRAGGSLR